MTSNTITREQAAKVLSVIDAGLTYGKGVPIPGKMCVEAAVCYGLGLPHGDDPQCVSRALRQLKIRLNDSSWSSDQARAKGLRRLGIAQLGSRGTIDDTEFTRRVADLAIRKYVPLALRAAAGVHKDIKHQAALNEAASRCERDGLGSSAKNARAVAMAADAHGADAAAAYAHAASASAEAAAYAHAHAAAAAYADAYAHAHAAAAEAAAYASAAYASGSKPGGSDHILSVFAEDVVQILIQMKAPGCAFLDLATYEAA
jgi:hypothetical protein